MSFDIAISVKNISKCYLIYDRPQDRLKQSIFRYRRYFREFWALKDVSFEVKKGETVGIIGRNGSGKSTLLQIICGTLTPTGGVVETNGRIAALLELGSGFNPEFTGRENVYMNGAVIGLSKEEIDARFDDIAAFADIGEFIDQPVKMYSSGMVVRLAFAVAINVEPQILVVDEALAVGDEPFQRKCYSRIERIRDSGATILLVTHAASTVTQMCSRALLLESGHRVYFGDPKIAVEHYHKIAYSKKEDIEYLMAEITDRERGSSKTLQTNSNKNDKLTPARLPSSVNFSSAQPGIFELGESYDQNLHPVSTMEYSSSKARINNVRILNSNGQQVNILAPHRIYRYTYEVHFFEDVECVHFGMLIKTTTGLDLGAIGSHPFGKGIQQVKNGQIYAVEFRFINLFSPGTYFMNAGCSGVINGEERFLHRIIDVLAFRIEDRVSNLRYAGPIQIAADNTCQLKLFKP